MPPVSSITKFLTSPSKIAKALDWKRSSSVLSLHLGKDSMDLAVTSHPSSTADEELILPLPSIPLKCQIKDNRKVLQSTVLNELAAIVEKFNVCGMVVSWPVQKEGWCGAPCGRVLYTLDQMARHEDIVSPNRPVALWDGHHFHSNEDEWGRSAIYSHISKKEVHLASKEQYEEEGSLAAEIAYDYLRHHWPDLYSNDEEHWSGKKKPVSSSSSSLSPRKEAMQSSDFSWSVPHEDAATYSKACS